MDAKTVGCVEVKTWGDIDVAAYARAYADASERYALWFDELKRQRRELQDRLEAVQGIHVEHGHVLFGGPDPCMILFGSKCAKSGCCSECGKKYPCPTVRAAKGGE